jgi:hypothetical protein
VGRRERERERERERATFKQRFCFLGANFTPAGEFVVFQRTQKLLVLFSGVYDHKIWDSFCQIQQ